MKQHEAVKVTGEIQEDPTGSVNLGETAARDIVEVTPELYADIAANIHGAIDEAQLSINNGGSVHDNFNALRESTTSSLAALEKMTLR